MPFHDRFTVKSAATLVLNVSLVTPRQSQTNIISSHYDNRSQIAIPCIVMIVTSHASHSLALLQHMDKLFVHYTDHRNWN